MKIFRQHPALLYVIYVIAVLLVLDAAVAHMFWRRLATHEDYYDIEYRCDDPLFHQSLERNVVSWGRWGGLDPFRTNSLGFKDASPREVPREPQGHRIVFIGDSFTEGVGLPFEKTFVGIIGQDLSARNTEVLNAAACSYSPKLYYFKIRYLLEDLGLKFDELVVFIDMSDIQDEIVYMTFNPRSSGGKRHLIHAFRRYAIRHSVIGNLLDREVQKVLASWPRGAAHGAWTGTLEDYSSYEEYIYERSGWYSDANYGKWGAKGAALAKEYMSRLAALCRSKGVRLTVAVYPWPRQVDEHVAENRHVVFWKTFARQEHLDFVNFFPLFMRPDPDAVIERYYMRDNYHLNEAGNRLIAEGFLKWYRSRHGDRTGIGTKGMNADGR